MARLSLLNTNKKRISMVSKFKNRRLALKEVVDNKQSTFEEKIEAVHKLARLPRNSSATRVRNRCKISGRPRGFYRQFELSRIALRELGSIGLIPGLTKSSW